MEAEWDIVVVGSGNAAMSAALAAQQRGCRVLVIEKAQPDLAGGNTAYPAGAKVLPQRTCHDRASRSRPRHWEPNQPMQRNPKLL